MEYNCTCEAGYKGEVYHCPMHAAAPAMHEALLSALGSLVALGIEDKSWGREILTNIVQAIAKAEGKEMWLVKEEQGFRIWECPSCNSVFKEAT